MTTMQNRPGLEPLRHVGMGPALAAHDEDYAQPPQPPSPPGYSSAFLPSEPQPQPQPLQLQPKPGQRVTKSTTSMMADARGASAHVLARAACLFLASALALAVAGLLARSLAVYGATRGYRVVAPGFGGLVMPAWPPSSSSSGALLLPTYLLLGAAVATLVLGMLTAVAWCLAEARGRWKARLGVALSVGLPSVSLGLFVAAIVVFMVRDGPDGLRGWSCAHSAVEVDFDRNEVGLGRVCNALNAAWGLSIAIAVLHVVALVVATTSCLRATRTATNNTTMSGRFAAKERRRATKVGGYHELEPMGDARFNYDQNNRYH